jgi:hypothetical protein
MSQCIHITQTIKKEKNQVTTFKMTRRKCHGDMSGNWNGKGFFQNRITKHKKEKVHKWDHIKLNLFCRAEQTQYNRDTPCRKGGYVCNLLMGEMVNI